MQRLCFVAPPPPQQQSSHDAATDEDSAPVVTVYINGREIAITERDLKRAEGVKRQ